jgi:imidazoleglycerol-phosphate dehydratase
MPKLSPMARSDAGQRHRAARTARVQGITGDSAVLIKLNLDGQGIANVETGLPFYDRMIARLGHEGGFDVHVRARASLGSSAGCCAVDTALALGQAVRQALGDLAGLRRFGYALVPLDEALCRVTVDLSSQPLLVLTGPPATALIGSDEVTPARHIWVSFTAGARLSLGIQVLEGRYARHVGECQFMGVARALRDAARLGDVPVSAAG